MVNVSIVICTYNRAESLRETLGSLHAQKTDRVKAEILVVDNNSGDPTRQVVQDFSKMSRWPVIYLFEGQQGLSYARNTGIRHAKGPVMAFLDDDVVVDAD